MVQHIHQNSLETSLRQESNDFIFSNVPYAGKVIPEVRLLGDLLDGGSKKNNNEWRQYCREHRKAGTILTSEMAYQLARKVYALRDVQDSASQRVRDAVLTLLQKDFIQNYPHTGTKVKYVSGLDAVVNHFNPEGKERTSSLQIPEFTRDDKYCSYLTLANEQPKSALVTVKNISVNARPMLEALLGEGYEQAGAVWQYVALPRRNNGNLREVRLFFPTPRNRNIWRCVVLGIYDANVYVVGANGYGGCVKLARGWVANSK